MCVCGGGGGGRGRGGGGGEGGEGAQVRHQLDRSSIYFLLYYFSDECIIPSAVIRGEFNKFLELGV